MAHAVQLLFDDRTDAAVRALWQRLDAAGVPSLAGHSHRRHRPHVTLAVAGAIAARTRDALRVDLAPLAVPDLWLHTLGAFPTERSPLFLGALVDTELLAVHSTAHDVLAGRVQQPSAYYLPGAWVPHCTLAPDLTADQLASGLVALHPVSPVRATVQGIGICDTRTGEVDVLHTMR